MMTKAVLPIAVLFLFGCIGCTEYSASNGPANTGAASSSTMEDAAEPQVAATANAVLAPASPPDAPTATAVATESADRVTLKILDYDQILALIKSHKGKVVVMDAWSTSCEPCKKEFPNLVALHKEYGPDKVACISLSFDYEGIGKPEEVQPLVLEFLVSQKANFDNVMSSIESDELYKKFQLASVPAVFVYDQQGNLAKRFDNESIQKPEEAFTYQDVRSLVAKLVKGQ